MIPPVVVGYAVGSVVSFCWMGLSYVGMVTGHAQPWKLKVRAFLRMADKELLACMVVMSASWPVALLQWSDFEDKK